MANNLLRLCGNLHFNTSRNTSLFQFIFGRFSHSIEHQIKIIINFNHTPVARTNRIEYSEGHIEIKKKVIYRQTQFQLLHLLQ